VRLYIGMDYDVAYRFQAITVGAPVFSTVDSVHQASDVVFGSKLMVPFLKTFQVPSRKSRCRSVHNAMSELLLLC
jgi:hypothetical protein